MICMHCSTAQPTAQYCQNCNIRLAKYYCDKVTVCCISPSYFLVSFMGWLANKINLSLCWLRNMSCWRRTWEGLLSLQGLSRLEVVTKFQTCNVCMSMSLLGSHRCIERNTECDCPICGDFLFTSPETVVFMPCGHSIHQKCYNQHIKSWITFPQHY